MKHSRLKACIRVLAAWLLFTAPAGFAKDNDQFHSSFSGQADQCALKLDNKLVRVWYKHKTSPEKARQLDAQWKREGISLRERAYRAWEFRHFSRIQARGLMRNQAEVENLQQRDQALYGCPHGPTFDWLVRKSRQQGVSEEDAFQDIIDSATRTNSEVNRKYGLE